MFQRKPLSSAVAIALGVSAAELPNAQATDSLFFPYFAIGDNVTTIISVINTAQGTALFQTSSDPMPAGSTTGNLHYRVYYKNEQNQTIDEPTSPCLEVNGYLPTSAYDLQSFDLGGRFGSNTFGVLYEKNPPIHNDWLKAETSFSILNGMAPARGYMVVSNNDLNASTNTRFSSLSGEAFLIDFTNGAAWGYQAWSRDGGTVADGGGFNYSSGYAARQGTLVTISPPLEFTTAFFVIPVSNDQAPTGGINNYAGRVTIATSHAADASKTVSNDFYDRDENLWSGTRDQDVVCMARLELQKFFSDAAWPHIQRNGGGDDGTDGGGWIGMYNYRTLGGNPANLTSVPVSADCSGGCGSGDVHFSDASYLTTKNVDSMGHPIAGSTATVATVNSGAVILKLEYNNPDGNGTINGENIGSNADETLKTFNNGYMLAP